MPMITDWLMVAITSVYVIATVFICIANIRSAAAARKQTEELQRQFYATNRPIVTVEVIYLKRCYLGLRFTNHGSLTAFNFMVKINDEFINSLQDATYKGYMKNNQNSVRTIGVGQSFDIFFGESDYLRQKDKVPIIGRMQYNGCNSSIYAEDFRIDTVNYGAFFSVSSDMDDIVNALKDQTKKLDAIEKNIAKIKK